MNMAAKTVDNRFQYGAQDYDAYLKTPERRLRADLAFGSGHCG